MTNKPYPRRVLMATMSLDIGGAETHIVELSRELARRGIDVTVASNGGAYVPELETAGVHHVALPLHSKNPIAVARSLSGLRRLIREGNFDIVHAHARIPAFLCGILARQMHFRFVTTAHWVFKVNWLWKRITNWGERSVSVSRDIKQYLIENYGLYADNISITINGIDTDRFSPSNDRTAACRALGLDEQIGHRILCVSRIDRDRSLAPLVLASVAGELAADFDDLEVVIAGDGDDFARLKEAADRSNAAAGRQVVRLAGATTDVAAYIAACDYFVGASRAALEAMAAGKPLIAAGNEGYLGIYTPALEAVAYRTNFCYRGCPPCTAEQMLADLRHLLSLPQDDIARMSRDNRSLIERIYSVRRMADDYCAMYAACTPYRPYRQGDVVISGYYGYGNSGDDSLLCAILDALHQADPEMRITVLGRHSKKMQQRYGVRCIGRYQMLSIWRELKDAKLLLSGGGSLLQDITSNRSLLYYSTVIAMAQHVGCHVAIYGSGIGPLCNEKNRVRVAALLRQADRITLRDPQSLATLHEMGIRCATVTADPAYLLPPSEEGWCEYQKVRLGILPPEAPHTDENGYFLVSLRPWAATAADLRKQLSAACHALAKQYRLRPVFIVMQDKYDDAVSRALTQDCADIGAVCAEGLSAGDLIALCRDAALVLSMRLHLLIYAANAGAPFIGLSYDPKVDAMTDAYALPDGLPPRIPIRDCTADRIVHMANQILTDRETCTAAIARTAAAFRSSAREDAEQIAALLHRYTQSEK